jgi:hypothetical protein
MVLYKKVFQLGKDVSFFEYITALRKKYFPNYVSTIDQIPSTEIIRLRYFSPHHSGFGDSLMYFLTEYFFINAQSNISKMKNILVFKHHPSPLIYVLLHFMLWLQLRL